jgi:hypothetical protein
MLRGIDGARRVAKPRAICVGRGHAA